MKTGQKFYAQRGTVLVFALLILVVGGTILGGIAQLAVTQSIAGQAEWEAVERRVQTENSRVLARQYILTQMWQGFGGLPAATLNNSATGGLGGFQITSVEPDFGYWLSVTQDDTNRINPFNLFERGGFQSAWANGLLRTRSDDSSTNNANWGFQIRTRSPIAAGFAFVNHRPATNLWAPLRRINMQQADYAVGFTNLPRMPVSSVTNTNTGDSTGFLGFLLLPKAEAAFGDLLATPTGVESVLVDTSNPVTARIEINLDTFSYTATQDDSHFYEVPASTDPVTVTNGVTNTNYNVPVTTLLLSGPGAANNLPLQIFIPANNTSLTNLILSGANSRIVYLYRQGPASPPLRISTTGGNNIFRIGMTLDCAADLNISGSLTVRGGFRTGSPLDQSTGDFTLVADNDPTWKFDAIADRMMWLEDQRSR